MVDWKAHLQRAIDHYGSQPKLGRAIGCSQSKISWLLKVATQIDAETAVAIDRATVDAPRAGRVTKSQLRPDLWPSHRSRAEHEVRAAS